MHKGTLHVRFLLNRHQWCSQHRRSTQGLTHQGFVTDHMSDIIVLPVLLFIAVKALTTVFLLCIQSVVPAVQRPLTVKHGNIKYFDSGFLRVEATCRPRISEDSRNESSSSCFPSSGRFPKPTEQLQAFNVQRSLQQAEACWSGPSLLW